MTYKSKPKAPPLLRASSRHKATKRKAIHVIIPVLNLCNLRNTYAKDAEKHPPFRAGPVHALIMTTLLPYTLHPYTAVYSLTSSLASSLKASFRRPSMSSNMYWLQYFRTPSM